MSWVLSKELTMQPSLKNSKTVRQQTAEEVSNGERVVCRVEYYQSATLVYASTSSWSVGRSGWQSPHRCGGGVEIRPFPLHRSLAYTTYLFYLFKHPRQRVYATYMPVKSITISHMDVRQ